MSSELAAGGHIFQAMLSGLKSNPLIPITFFILSLFISACTTSPTVLKIGLVAPFEGADRAIGYDSIYAARLAVREFNSQNAEDHHVKLALVALDNGGLEELAIDSSR
ncbi:MAG: hypothetical protein AAF633_20660, partial [Chloroflexota bacterium]